MPIPAKLAPSQNTWLGVARELTTGTAVVPSNTIPLNKNEFSPEDTPKFLDDLAVRGVMAEVFNKILGVEQSTFSYGGPAFLDVEGFFLDNVFGDLQTTSNGTLGTAQPLSSSIAVGATSLTVGVSLGSVVTGSVIQITDAGTGNEVVIATAGSSGTTVNFVNTPTRFSHNTSATAALQTVATNYTHKWAALNSGTGQPPTHTLTDFTSLTTSVGARAYPSACVSQFDLTGNVEQLLMAKANGLAWISAAAASTPVNTTAFVKPIANWASTVTIGGSSVFSVGDWSVSFKRQLQPYFVAQNSQNPYVIARGPLGIDLTFGFTVPSDETPLTYMTTSGYQAVVLSISNGLAGANLISLTITCTTAQAIKSKPERSGVVVGYQTNWAAVANTTDKGGSGGMGPGTISLTNAIATY